MSEVKTRKRASPDLIAAIVAIVLPAIVIALWTVPRAAPPFDAPVLTIAETEMRADVARERALASRAPDSEAEQRRRELYLAQARAEIHPERGEILAERARALTDALAAVASEHGDDAIAAIRARDVGRTIDALAGRGDDETRAAELGAFRRSLERWGAVRDGRRVAGETVVRALAAARWNVVHGLEPTSDLGPLRLRAYHGWLALHGDAADPALRARALEAYDAAGGADADEMRGVLAWQAGDAEGARAAFDRAYARDGTIRLRAHALAAAQAAETE